MGLSGTHAVFDTDDEVILENRRREEGNLPRDGATLIV